MKSNKINILSVNLEDYFQVAPLRAAIPQRHWPRFALRIEKNTLRTLDMLDAYSAKATFFVLGWLADRCPDLIAEVARRGHEVASKGYYHSTYALLGQQAFEDDFLRSRDVIENASGKAVLGYRIAEGSLPTDDLRPYEFLAMQGIEYDSSVRPFGLAFAGKSQWSSIKEVSGPDWSLTEVPLTSIKILGIPVPVTGGNYLRQLPQPIYDAQLAQHLKGNDDPWHLYFHVWELDSDQPRISAISKLKQVRQYRNLDRVETRLRSHLQNHRFQSIASHLGLVQQTVAPHALAPVSVMPEVHPDAGLERQSVTVVIPCYNEEETLPYLKGTLTSLAEQHKATLKLSFVFVDDGSKDSTWAVLNDLFGGRDDCTLIKHRKNRGIARATMTGIQAAKDEIVCGIDCDCSFDPHTLADMVPLLTDGVDMVQASPYHPDGGVTNVPGWRLALSKNLSRIYRLVLRHKFFSYTACFRVYRRSSIVNIRCNDEGFLGIAEMFIRLDRSGARIIEYPTVLEARLIGVSKMKTLRVIRAHLQMLARLVLGRLDSVQSPPNPPTQSANSTTVPSGK